MIRTHTVLPSDPEVAASAPGVLVVTIDRPERRNAVDRDTAAALADAFRAFENDDALAVAVLTGAGGTFCAGADLKSFADGGGNRVDPDISVDGPMGPTRMQLSKPVIAAVNGAAAGIGMALACFCDVIFASEGAKFTVAHGKLGLPAEYGLSWMLPRMVGLPRAMDILMTSRVVTAEEGERIGMVLRVVPVDRLLEEALAYAEALAASVASQSLRVTRHQVYLDQHRDVGTAVAESKRLLDELMGTAEYREGVAALIEKRPPNF